ncbi:TPA: hypothetical protein HA318_02305 [Candidatus Micrarchaeota archaeon]|nr:MAG: hypothetical protein AUJ65_02570 [Candidatus Micrarchaeota archaeon CG1_02_51_15]HII38811.1 hypothetical protein [Candidatus Micrarchaeota archaeon]
MKDNNRALDSGDLRKVGETACALANSGGGKFTVRGKKRVSEDVSKAVEKVFPNPAYEVRPEGKIFQVEIFAIKNEAGTFQGRVFVRAGNSNVALEGKALQDFLVTRRTLSFDDSFSRAGIDDLELQKLVRFLKKKNPGMNFEEDNVADYLWELGIEKRDDSFAIKNAAVLFFAKQPRRFIPHSEVRLTRFNGTRAEEVRDAICLDSTLPENLDAAQQFVYKNAKAAFPKNAVCEALANALVHRDYASPHVVHANVFDDRLEITSPGGTPSGEFQALGSISVPRNHFLYRLMRDSGIITNPGTGIASIRNEARNTKAREPSFEEKNGFFKMTFFNRRWVNERELSERQRIALTAVKKRGRITSIEHAKATRVSIPISVSDLNDLCKKKLLKKIGSTRGAFYAPYPKQ